MESLSEKLPGIIIGGGVFNTQMNDDPLKLPIVDIIDRAFQYGANAIDTSPYYGPSEELIGKALVHEKLAKYNRSDYILMTKAGRIGIDQFDYSKEWIEKSVRRSLERLHTDYLDCVYCHDVEFVTKDEVLEAVSTLFRLKREGVVHNVGISAYPPEVISNLIPAIVDKCGQAPDVVQSYAHFNLQNTRLDAHLDKWRAAGVSCVINSSPLNMGLLSGRPAADFHLAPIGLREKAMEAAQYCIDNGVTLPDIALKFVIGKYNAIADRNGGGFVISGISFVEELESVVKAYSEFLKPIEPSAMGPVKKVGKRTEMRLDQDRLQSYQELFDNVRNVFGEWLEVGWESPPPGFQRRPVQ
uniref:ARAD1B09922p n=1 Tax=Blastobotrys adeninivorans TaxID=409370 RepID=A0A060TAT9_BLAAD